MTVFVGSLIAAATVASLLATAFAFAAQRGDPAGRGLGQAYLVVALGVAWLLVASAVVAAWLGPAAAAATARDLAAFGALAAGFTSPLASLPYLAKAPLRSRWPAVVCGNLFAVPAALLVHAGWRAAVLPLPSAWAVQGCFTLVGIGSLVPWLARALSRRQPRTAAPLYPALVLSTPTRVTVVRAAADLAGLPPASLAGDVRLIDADGQPWTLRPDPTAPVLARAGERMMIAELRALVLAVPRLHEDPDEDARIRRLIPLQRDVVALSFVLPR